MAKGEGIKLRTLRKSAKKAKAVKSIKKKEKRENIFSDILSKTIECDSVASERMLINRHPIELSPEQILFCLEYVNCGYIIVDAVQNTFSTDGWSSSKISNVGQKLLKLQKIKDYIETELNNRCERLRVSADWAARKYKAWSEIDVSSYLTVAYVKHGGRGKAFIARPQIRLKTKLENMPKEVRCAIKGISVSAQGDLKVDFIDQKGALDALLKLLGLTENKLMLESKAPINIFFDEQDSDA